MQNALGFMPGEHDWMDKKAMPGQAPMPEKKPGPIMNALGAAFQIMAPDSYARGKQQYTNRQVGNALASKDYGGAADIAYKAGNLDTGYQVAQMGDQAAKAQRQQEAQGVLNLFQSVQPAQISEMAMTDPVGFERMTGMTADEYMQAGQRMAQAGLSPDQFHQYVIQKAQAELGMQPAGPVEGKAINNRLVNPVTGEVMGDYSDPSAPNYERVTTADGIYEYIPGQPDSMRKIGDAPVKSPLVNVNTGDAVDPRPVTDKPDRGFQRVWDSENNTWRDAPIPGSDTARERETYAIKSAAAQRADDEQFATMTDKIDKAIEQADYWSAGLMSQATSQIGMTPARDLRATLDTIVANIGFDKLNEMRQTSPTGGALGNVTERELAFLQSVRGSLDQAQSPPQLRQTLKEVKDSLSRLYEARRIAAQLNMTNSGERVPSGNLNEDPEMNDLLQYMTPEERALFGGAQ